MSVLHSDADAAVACPACETVLRIPLSGANRRARCRTCEQVFQVPTRRELVDQTVAYMMQRSQRSPDDTDVFDTLDASQNHTSDNEVWGDAA